MFVRHLIMASTFGIIIALGLFWPDALVWLIRQADDFRNWFSDQFHLTGYTALIVQLSGAGTALVLSVVAILVGLGFRWIAHRAFTWNRILTATFLPLLAHVTEGVLGYFAPATLTPVYKLADWLLTLINQDWLTSMRAFDMETHAKNLIESAIIIVLLLLVWQGLKLAVRRFRRPTTTTTPPSGGAGKDSIMTKEKRSWWSITFTPITLTVKLLGLPFRLKGRKGIYLGPVTFWLFVGLLAYLLALWVMGGMEILRYVSGNANWDDIKIIFTVPAVASILSWIWVFNQKKFTVSTASFVALTLLGRRIGVYLTEGNYYFNPADFLIGLSTKIASSFTAKDSQVVGALKIGEIDFRFWDSGSHKENEDPNFKIELNSRSGAGVKLSATAFVEIVDPDKLLTAPDPAMLFGESGREALRASSVKLTDLDISDEPPLLGKLMRNYQLLVARLSKTYGQHREGSLLFKKGGSRYTMVVEKGDDLTKKTTEFENGVRPEMFDPAVLKLAQDNGKLRTEMIEIASAVEETAAKIGLRITKILISDVALSPKVQDAVDKASAEAHEAESELRTAESAEQAAGKYAASIKKHGLDATNLGAAATGTPGVQNINLSGLKETILEVASIVMGKKTRS